MRKTDVVLLACVPWTALAALGWAVLIRPAPVTARAQPVKVVVLTPEKAEELSMLWGYLGAFEPYVQAKRTNVSKAQAIAALINQNCRYRTKLNPADLDEQRLLILQRNDVTEADAEDVAAEAGRCIERRRLRAGL